MLPYHNIIMRIVANQEIIRYRIKEIQYYQLIKQLSKHLYLYIFFVSNNLY